MEIDSIYLIRNYEGLFWSEYRQDFTRHLSFASFYKERKQALNVATELFQGLSDDTFKVIQFSLGEVLTVQRPKFDLADLRDTQKLRDALLAKHGEESGADPVLDSALAIIQTLLGGQSWDSPALAQVVDYLNEE